MSSLRYWLHAGSMWVDDKGRAQGVPAPFARALELFSSWLKKRDIQPDRDKIYIGGRNVYQGNLEKHSWHKIYFVPGRDLEGAPR